MKYILTYLFLVIGLLSLAQPNTIFKKYFLPHSYNANSIDVIETTSNNYIIYGSTYDTIAGKVIPVMTLIGLDQSYNITWRKTYGDTSFAYLSGSGISSFFIKKNNYLYGALMAYDSVHKQPGVFMKFDYNGDTIWQKKYYSNSDQFFFTSVTPSIDNGFFITGYIQSSVPSYNGHDIVAAYLLKTDANGNKLWDKRFYKSNLDETQEGQKIVQDSVTKKIIIVGTQDVGIPQYSNVMILDSLGNLLVQKGGNGLFGNFLSDVIKLKDSNYLASGVYIHPDHVVNGYTTGKSYLVKFDLNGNQVFSLQYDSLETGNDILRVQELSDSSIITAGTLETMMIYGTGINQIFRIMKVDKYGNMIWKKYFDNYTNNLVNENLSAMNLTHDGSIIFTTEAWGGYTPPSPYTFYKTDTSFCDVNAVACYNVVGIEVGKIIKQNIHCYPNPASNYCTINLQELGYFKPVTIEVTNTLGQVIYKSNTNTALSHLLNTSSYDEGIYYITVRQNNSVVAEQKLIILK